MNCPRCNAPIENGDVFCQNCGTKIEAVNNVPQDFQVQEEPKEKIPAVLEINSTDMNNKVYEPTEQAPSVLEINSTDMNKTYEPKEEVVSFEPTVQQMNNTYEVNNQELVTLDQNYQDMNSMNMTTTNVVQPTNDFNVPEVNSFSMNEPDRLDDEVILPTPQVEQPEIKEEKVELSAIPEEKEKPNPVRNNTEYANMQGENKKQQSNATPLIAIMVVVILVLTGALIYSIAFSDDKENEKDPNNNNPSTEVVTKTVNTYTFNGYKFEAPEGWKFSETTKSLTIVNKTQDVAISSQLVNLTFVNVSASLTQIEANWQQSGYEVSNRTSATLNNKQYYMYDLKYNGFAGYIIITDLTTNTLLSVVIGQTQAVTVGTKDEVLNIATSLTPDTTSSISPIEDPKFTASQEAIQNIPFNTETEQPEPTPDENPSTNPDVTPDENPETPTPEVTPVPGE